MASLQTLRDKGGLVVAVVIALALVAFLLGDLLSSSSQLFGSSDKVGEIQGTTITASEYQTQLDYLQQINEIATGQSSLDDAAIVTLANQTWETLIRNIAFLPDAEKLGLMTTAPELQDLFYGSNPSPLLQQIFANPQTGIFDPQYLAAFQQNLDADETGRMRLFWNYVQNEVADQAVAQKYSELNTASAYTTSLVASSVTKLMDDTYDIQYATKNYFAVPDSVLTIRESELKNYYSENKSLFKSGETRSLSYVVFETLPSEEDRQAASNFMDGMASDFATTDNPSYFAVANSQEAADTRYYAADELAGDLSEFVQQGDMAQVYGPVLVDDTYTLARISDVKNVADSLDLSHIMFSLDQRATADSLLAVLQNGGDFEAAANTYSLDQQSIGGKIGVLDPQMLPTELSSVLISAKKGDIKLAETAQTLHIFKVGEVYGVQPRTQLARVSYTVEPSETTRNKTYAEANAFATTAAGSLENYNKAVIENALVARTAQIGSLQREIQGLSGSREIVRWALNEAPKTKVSGVESIGDMFIVSALTNSTEAGFVPFDQVQDQIRELVVHQKKGEYIAAEFEKAGSLEAIAQITKDGLLSASDLSFNKYLLSQNTLEPAVLGAICALEPGKLSKPIIGLRGVYSVVVTDKKSDPASAEIEKERISAELQQSAFSLAYQAFIGMCDIEDVRYKFF
ncbi:MAG: peptidylprolyl isomerase [Rikenellaceae bacterium]